MKKQWNLHKRYPTSKDKEEATQKFLNDNDNYITRTFNDGDEAVNYEIEEEN